MAGLLTAALSGFFNLLGPTDNDEPKSPRPRDRGVSAASRPAETSDGPGVKQGIRSPAWSRDSWSRRDWRGGDGMGGLPDHSRYRQGMGGRSWEDEDDEQMSPEQVAELMNFAEREFPKLHRRLVSLRETNPTMFRNMIRRVRGPVSEIVRIQQHDPKAARQLIDAHRIEVDLTELQSQYQAAKSDAQREQLKARMRELVIKRCEFRLRRLKAEITELEKRLEHAKKELAKREKDQDQVVDQELNRLLTSGATSPREGRLWSSGGPSPGFRGGKRDPGPPSTKPSDAPTQIE
ncbi:MAG: hypothetical protein ACUVXJ_07970 [Phycisphaerae bacterium]